MKLEKKMATLFAAVLIAMMGVMPALAVPTASVPITVDIPSLVRIRVISGDVDFGSLIPEETIAVYVTLQNYGTVDVTIEETVSGPFFIANLVVVVVPSLVVGESSSSTCLELTIPEFVQADTYTGSILFMATGPA